MHIAVVNKSTHLAKDLSSLSLMTQACSTQMRKHAAPAWYRAPASVLYYPDETQIPEDSDIMYMFDDADQAGALGYHDETPAGLIYGRIFVGTVLDSGGQILTGELSVSSVLSHEVLELFGDPNCNLWADMPTGNSVAYELCDPVENDSYTIKVKGKDVSVSNFVTPRWFDPKAPKGTSFDYLGKLSAAFTMSPGGYLIVRTEGKESQVMGTIPEWKKPVKAFKAARTARRQMIAGAGVVATGTPSVAPAATP